MPRSPTSEQGLWDREETYRNDSQTQMDKRLESPSVVFMISNGEQGLVFVMEGFTLLE